MYEIKILKHNSTVDKESGASELETVEIGYYYLSPEDVIELQAYLRNKRLKKEDK